MEIVENGGWIFFLEDEEVEFNQDKIGKWMYYYSDSSGRDFAEEKCCEAVERGIVKEAKVSKDTTKGVACFYLECDDKLRHQDVIEFFLDNDMIQKTQSGRLYNISFKRDSQTRAGEYGSKFKSDIKLENFVDLNTGEWVC